MQNSDTHPRSTSFNAALSGAQDESILQTSHRTAAPAPLPSQSLLQGQKTVRIVHHDQIYILQATRLGKLILTK
jgi:hemin uptake protein HemP